MKILLDQCVPAPLRKFLGEHDVKTAYQMGWQQLRNGELIAEAEKAFQVFVTTDKNLKYQQNLSERKIAIIVLPTTSWVVIQENAGEISEAINRISSNDFVEIEF